MNKAGGFSAFIHLFKKYAGTIYLPQQEAISTRPAMVGMFFKEFVPLNSQLISNMPRFNHAKVNLVFRATYAAPKASWFFQVVLTVLEKAGVVLLKHLCPL